MSSEKRVLRRAADTALVIASSTHSKASCCWQRPDMRRRIPTPGSAASLARPPGRRCRCLAPWASPARLPALSQAWDPAERGAVFCSHPLSAAVAVTPPGLGMDRAHREGPAAQQALRAGGGALGSEEAETEAGRGRRSWQSLCER